MQIMKINAGRPWKAMKIGHDHEVLKILFSGKFLLVVALVATGSVLGDNEVEKADSSGGSCHLREMELCCVSSASLFQNPNGIPIDGPEFKRVCENLEESAECHEDYAERCLTKSQHLITGMFVGEIFDMAKEFCKPGSELRTQYTKHASCFRQVQKRYQAECVSDLQVALAPIHKIGIGARLSTGCCATNRFKDCIFTRIEKECGDEAVEFIQTLLDRAFGNALNNLCRDYDPDSEPCRPLLPKPGTIPYNGRNTSAISRIISSYSGINMN